MAAGDRISGKDVFVSFAGQNLSGDFTSVGVDEAGDLVDLTAGAEGFHYYIYVRKDGTSDVESFYNSGTVQTEFDAVAVGSAGTFIVGPKGTTATYPKLTWDRVVIRNRRMTLPFDDSVKVTTTVQYSSALSRGNWS